MMNTADSQDDALLLLRSSIQSKATPIPVDGPDSSTACALSSAPFLQFNIGSHHTTLAFTTPTRFISTATSQPVSLRSVYFAWLNKDIAVRDYIDATSRVNEELSAAGGANDRVDNLVFAEKLDLITWLESASNESDYIKPLPSSAPNEEVAAQADAADKIATGAAGGPAPTAQNRALPKEADPRLREILHNERRMGNRNTALRGTKNTDFTAVRKFAEAFSPNKSGSRVSKTGFTNGGPRPAGPSPSAPLSNGAKSPMPLVQNRTKPGRRPEPIILLSPSASSLLRMSNIKSFLNDGMYTPPDSTSTSTNLLHVSRLLPSIDPVRPLRFILVDTPELFKPDYWSRLAAVFTTGQTWQFKSYKWTSPPELFAHALGVHVGWRGEDVPSSVKGWGRGVVSVGIDKYNAQQGPQGRWRDREVVEGIWTVVEESMRNRGWGRDGLAGGR
ncbi:MAG: accessory factor associated with RNA polymerase II [Chrysothrix sp. TS-e1954]|nr:MAG: accessory factor associated with RNA polymerase II [Chrysothrix sp. TS-e1954]